MVKVGTILVPAAGAAGADGWCSGALTSRAARRLSRAAAPAEFVCLPLTAGIPSRTRHLGERIPSRTRRLGARIPSRTRRLGAWIPSRTRRLGARIPFQTRRLGARIPSRTRRLGARRTVAAILFFKPLLAQDQGTTRRLRDRGDGERPE